MRFHRPRQAQKRRLSDKLSCFFVSTLSWLLLLSFASDSRASACEGGVGELLECNRPLHHLVLNRQFHLDLKSRPAEAAVAKAWLDAIEDLNDQIPA